MRACASFRPGDRAVFEHERRARRVDGGHRGLHDRLERLLQIEGLGDGLRDGGERFELGDTALRVVVELGVLDRLRDLARDRHEEVDLVGPELTGSLGADVQGSLEALLGEDGNGEDRLVLLLAQVRETLEARVEMSRLRDHHRRSLGGRGAGDPLARAHLRDARELLHPRAVGGAQNQFVRRLIVEIDEARVGLEGLGDLVRDQLEDLVEVEGRVDRGDRLGQKPAGAGRSGP